MAALGAGALLGLSVRAVRRQGWLLVPRTVARVIARALMMIPWAVLVLQAVRAGRAEGASSVVDALVAGVPIVLVRPGSWGLLAVGVLLMAFGGWLLATVVRAGLLRQLAPQLGHDQTVRDVEFADGAVESAPWALMTGAIAGVLEVVALASSVGMVVAGMVTFTHSPGARAALLMTIATGAIVSVPVISIGLQVGFVRAVLFSDGPRCEGPLTALWSGLVLARRQASAILTVWFVAGVLQIAIAFVFGLADAVMSAAGQGELAILMLGPRALGWIAGLVALSAVELVLLGVYATLVQQDTGRLPEAPTDRVLPAIAVADPIG